MADPFVGEIRMFAGNFAPSGWAFCNGQLLSIAEYETLFALIGTTYGGDGQTTFGLPDLRGRLPMHQGTGTNLTTRVIGQSAGNESVTLNQNQIPIHSHQLNVSSGAAVSRSPQNAYLASPSAGDLYLDDLPNVAMNAGSVGQSGASQPHENMSPFLAISFIISLYGIFPSQG